MTTQTAQALSCDLGYTIPTDARDAGVHGLMEAALDRARESHDRLAAEDRAHAQYAVPLAFHRRFLMRMNAREAFHFVRLRSRVQGHESYRRIAWDVKREIDRFASLIAKQLRALDLID